MPVKTIMENSEKLQSVLQENDSWVVLKLSATWCRPCKIAEPFFIPWFSSLKDHVNFYLLDIDENFEIYGFLTKKKRINGIPSFLAWKKGNTGVIPDLFYSGSDVKQINALFNTILSDSTVPPIPPSLGSLGSFMG